MQLQVARICHHHLHLVQSSRFHFRMAKVIIARTRKHLNLGASPDIHADVHGGVEWVCLHDSDVAVLGNVVSNVDCVALRVGLVDLHHLQVEG